jgi:probable DNA metabolism protein
MNVYVCSDSVMGIFSAIYEAWLERGEDAEIAFIGAVEQRLFCQYIEVEETPKKSVAVEKMIRKHLGDYSYQEIYQALLAKEEHKGTAILRTILAAKHIQHSHRIMEHLSNPYVEKVFRLSRQVAGEAHQYKGFVRFRELKNGILFSEIEPKSQVLTCIAGHFSDRLPLENFMIYDRTHKMFVVHQAQCKWVLVSAEELAKEMSEDISKEQEKFAALWKGFCSSISIAERENLLLQRQNLPLRYRKHMVE